MCRAQPTVFTANLKKERNTNAKPYCNVSVIFLLCAASGAAFAQKATILRVVVVKTDNPTAYAQEIEKGGKS